jgi:hypothetical protein
MAHAWAIEELKTAYLHDQRLNERLRGVLSQLAARPTASIPAACGGRAEMSAAYRLFDNEKATFENILQAHVHATGQRISAQPVVLLVQDTTEADLTRPQQQVHGAGPLDGASRSGGLLHALHAFTPDGTPLGTLCAAAWVRDEEPVNARLSRAERAATPIEEKESYRWVTTVQQAQAEAEHCPNTRLINVADSEADIYEFLVQAMSAPRRCDWIVPACEDRALPTEGQKPSHKHLRDTLLGQPVLFTKIIQVRGRQAKRSCETRGRRQPRQSRQAELAVRASCVTLRAPWRADRPLPAVTVNVVLVREIDPPPGEEPVEWLLLTSLPVDTLEAVRQVVENYCVGWMIEVFFRVLKSGCRVEERRFEEMDRWLTCLAVYLIVAWRTLYVCRLGRGCPDLNCEAVFEPAEWKSVWKVARREGPPAELPALGTVVLLGAQLGGYVKRKRSDPGPQTIRLGLQRMHDFALCWELFGREAETSAGICV